MKKKKYSQKFKKVWCEQFPMLECVEEIPHCKICGQRLPCNYNHMARHFNSKSHKLKTKLLKSTPQIRQYVDSKRDHNDHMKNSVKSAQLKLIVFLHEHNLPFLLMDHLPKLIASACPDSVLKLLTYL